MRSRKGRVDGRAGACHEGPHQRGVGFGRRVTVLLAQAIGGGPRRRHQRAGERGAAATRRFHQELELGAARAAPSDPDSFDAFHPRHVSPLVVALASADCSVTGKLYAVNGGNVQELENWRQGTSHTTEGPRGDQRAHPGRCR